MANKMEILKTIGYIVAIVSCIATIVFGIAQIYTPEIRHRLGLDSVGPTSPLSLVSPIIQSISDIPTTKLSCLPTQYTFLGDDWSSSPTFLQIEDVETQTFSHCPPTTTIQYDLLAVDDQLEKVELVCADGTTDITSLFGSPFVVENEELLHWKSSRIEFRQNCRIDFTIKDTKGSHIGMQIKLSSP
jgi:hypothetical protein